MPDQPMQWGLLSTARINRAVIEPLRLSKRNELAAVASRSLEKAQAYAQVWAIPRAFGSYEELLADPDIEAVYISVPNSLHVAWTIRAVEAGKHVLCEKPLALTLEEVDQVIVAAERTGRVVAEAFMYRHHPQTLQIKEMVTNGSIGTLQIVHGAFSYPLRQRTDVRWDPALGGGSIWDVGCYPISYARFLAGEEPVEAFGWRQTASTGVDALFVGQLRFQGGVIAQFDSSFRSQVRMTFEVVGTEGAIYIPNAYKPGLTSKVFLTRGDRTEEIELAGEPLYLGEVEDLYEAVRFGRAPRVSLEDTRGNIATILALLESARLGKPTRIGMQ